MPRLMLKPVLKIGGLVAFIGAIVLYLWWSMRIPSPREQDRVTHRQGIFSIIKPRDWEVTFNYGGDTRYLDTLEIRTPSKRPRDRRIFVGRLREKPDLSSVRDKLIDNQFQHQEAWVHAGRTRLEHYWRAIFQRDGQWYELVLWMPLPEDVPNSGFWPYLQSFRANPLPATMRSFEAG